MVRVIDVLVDLFPDLRQQFEQAPAQLPSGVGQVQQPVGGEDDVARGEQIVDGRGMTASATTASPALAAGAASSGTPRSRAP